MANCPNCGGMMRFNIKEQKVECSYCSSFFDPYEIDKVNLAECSKDEFGINVFTCPQCGGELMSSDHDLSGKCSFCGSPVVFDVKMRNEKRPQYIIPFRITKEDCKTKYLEAIKSCMFAPSALKDPEHIEEFRGIYVPYWLYTVKMDGAPFDIEGKYQHSDSKYDYTDIYRLKGKNQALFKEIYHDSSSVLKDDISEQVEPFQLHDAEADQLKPFTPSYFTGLYAEPADVEPEVYYNYAKDVAETKERSFLDEESEFSRFKISKDLGPEHFAAEVTDARLAYMPIWFLSYRKNDRVAYAALNGQTGQMVSDLPIDMKIFFGAIAVLSLILFAGLNLFTILPKTVTLMSVIVSFLTARLCRDDIRLLMQRTTDKDAGKKRNKMFDSSGTFGILSAIVLVALIAKIWMILDDDMSFLGSSIIYSLVGAAACVMQVKYLAATMKQIKGLVSEKYFAGILPIFNLIASCYGTWILFTNPVRDEYYYSAALVVIVITLISFTMIVFNYNKVATRPLPQFSIHKGGEDRA